MKKDPRTEPQYAEHVPYVVVYGEPGSRLVDVVVDPYTLLASHGNLKLNALYYINKQINPALDRALALIGVDVHAWFQSLPRSIRTLAHKRKTKRLAVTKKQRTIDSYYLSRHCPVKFQLKQQFCDLCASGV